jgi:hypothetical protein
MRTLTTSLGFPDAPPNTPAIVEQNSNCLSVGSKNNLRQKNVRKKK